MNLMFMFLKSERCEACGSSYLLYSGAADAYGCIRRRTENRKGDVRAVGDKGLGWECNYKSYGKIGIAIRIKSHGKSIIAALKRKISRRN